ncbi:MAG: hypothetical protein FJW34_13995 [Acidobacteria bacterium]|nr:hypothetical protein [Acidobacteriota bacterium]
MNKALVFWVMAITAAPAALWAQPRIRAGDGVLNASSYTLDIARGSWFVVFGTGLGPANLAVYSGNLPYPTELSGTRVSFTPVSGGAAVDARLWYTSAGQLAGLLPSTAAAGDYDVRVTYSGQTSPTFRAKVVERNFGFATQSQNGAGPAQATYGGSDLNRFTTGQLAQFTTRPAKAGDRMDLWGTGLGPDAGSDLRGDTSGDQTAAAQVKVIVGGIEVTPAYAGRSSGSPGLDQVVFMLPSNVATGCFVSLQVRAGGRLSNLGSIAVAEAGRSACSHPTLSEAQLVRLDQGGTLTIGSLSLDKTSMKMSVPGLGSFDSKTESVSGSFGRYTVDAVAGASFSVVQTGACTVLKRTGTQDEILEGRPPTLLDAGAQLLLNGPGAANKAVPREASSKYYDLTLYSSGFGGLGASGSPTLTQGTYTLSGAGGPDIGAFTARVDFPGEFVWSNQDAIADPVPRGSGLTIRWTGGGAGLVGVMGAALAQTAGTMQNPVYSATIFECTAQASAGSFTVPSSVLQQLPVVSSDMTSGSFGMMAVLAMPDATKNQGVFSAPLTAGGTADQAFFSYSVGAIKLTGWN